MSVNRTYSRQDYFVLGMAFPKEKWHMSPDTYADILKIMFKHGYGNGDEAACEVARKYNKALFTEYEVVVHFEW